MIKINKLILIAAFIVVLGAIGGGFMTWGKFQTKLSTIEDKEFVVNETVDLSGIQEQILELEKQLAILEAKINFTQAEGI
ncbi:hypothetical protein N9R19_01280 [Pelagibacterales bacterium]|nr:hypothetical protein [Pelagibacterales bacterium]